MGLCSVQVHATDAGNTYCVDWFSGGSGVGVYFLTHMHTDHLAGLFEPRTGCVKEEWGRRGGPKIVCSDQTQRLLLARGVPASRVYALPLQQACSVAAGSAGGPTVTLIDACHCPGSVMFHIQWDNLNHLHTGDFRYRAEIHGCDEITEQIQDVDKVFLDTTFYHPVDPCVCVCVCMYGVGPHDSFGGNRSCLL